MTENLREWLSRAVAAGASDLHLIAGYPPVLRLHGDLTELPEPPLTPEVTHTLVGALCPPEALARLRSHRNIDFSIEQKLDGGGSRFRVNVFHAGGHLAACLRVVPDRI